MQKAVSFVIALLSSFMKHAIDLESDRRLLNRIVTHRFDRNATLNNNTSLNSQRIPTLVDFNIICNKNEDRFQSLAICSRSDIFTSPDTEFNGPSLVTLAKSSFSSKTINLLLLYKKHNLPEISFCNWPQDFISSKSVDIISEDYNINAFQENDRLRSVLST